MRACVCGATYDAHRTGLTFADVRRMMWRSTDDPKDWRSKRRPAVLGFWRELKLGSWWQVHGACEVQGKGENQGEAQTGQGWQGSAQKTGQGDSYAEQSGGSCA